MSVPATSAQLPLAGFGGHWELIIIFLIILLLFGRRLPGVARSLGQGISSFKKGLNEPLEEEEKKKLAEGGKGDDSAPANS